MLRGHESQGAQVRAAKPVSDRATRYMRDGSILPRVSTSCDDLQRRITKSPRNVRPRAALHRAGTAFTSPRLASLSRPIAEKSNPDFVRAKGTVAKRLSKGSAQTDLDLECSRYCALFSLREHVSAVVSPRRPNDGRNPPSVRLAN